MMQLHQDFNKFKEKNTVIVVVGPDTKDKFKAYFEKNNFEFIGIPDEKGSLLKSLGQETKIFKLGKMPAQLLVDTSGKLKYIHYGHSMSDIPNNDELLMLL